MKIFLLLLVLQTPQSPPASQQDIEKTLQKLEEIKKAQVATDQKLDQAKAAANAAEARTGTEAVKTASAIANASKENEVAVNTAAKSIDNTIEKQNSMMRTSFIVGGIVILFCFLFLLRALSRNFGKSQEIQTEKFREMIRLETSSRIFQEPISPSQSGKILLDPEIQDLLSFSKENGLREFPTRLTLKDNRQYVCIAILKDSGEWKARIEGDDQEVTWANRRKRAALLKPVA